MSAAVVPAKPAGFIVTPGASADRTHATLVALEEGLADITVVRLTLGTTSVKRAVATIAEAAADLANELGVGPTEIALGGRSFGGRCASVAHAEGLAVHSLVLLSYPLHPPGKPDKLRVDHFGQITAPTLMVSGEKDPFGTPAEFARHVGAIQGPVESTWVAGNHAPKGTAEIVTVVAEFLNSDGIGAAG